MPLVGIKEILTEARRRRYGVLSLLGGNLDMVIGQVAAAEEQRAPLILAFNQEVTPQVPLELAMPMLVSVARRAKVPVATTLDHGDSLESVVRAIHLGTSSVMFDGSTLPYEENVRQTQRWSGLPMRWASASKRNWAVSPVMQQRRAVPWLRRRLPTTAMPRRPHTDPELAVDFVSRTGVDALAISFGNVHGTYQGEPNLDLELVREIHARVEIPLVMHGASGLADERVCQRSSRAGISKVCYYTAHGQTGCQRTSAGGLERRRSG